MLDDIEVQLSDRDNEIERIPEIIPSPKASSQNAVTDVAQSGESAESSEMIDENSLLQLISLFANNVLISLSRVHIRLSHKWVFLLSVI